VAGELAVLLFSSKRFGALLFLGSVGSSIPTSPAAFSTFSHHSLKLSSDLMH